LKRDEDYASAEKDGDTFKCLYFDNQFNYFSAFAKFSDLGKKQYNYDKDIPNPQSPFLIIIYLINKINLFSKKI
jgi:hypothetical protein